MLIKRPNDILPSHITDEAVYLKRRELLKMAGIVTAGGIANYPIFAAATSGPAGKVLQGVQKSPFSTDQQPNSWEDVTGYNNYYEFGTGKEDPARNAGDFKPRPWTVVIKGECDKPGKYNYEDLVSPHVLEERIYRLRCVEAWSMVIPWVGIPLASILKQFSPNSNAKYVRF
jgi:sulfoxide reductase catalytic subunit YedY